MSSATEPGAIVWTNTDILNPDGTVFLASSEPTVKSTTLTLTWNKSDGYLDVLENFNDSGQTYYKIFDVGPTYEEILGAVLTFGFIDGIFPVSIIDDGDNIVFFPSDDGSFYQMFLPGIDSYFGFLSTNQGLDVGPVSPGFYGTNWAFSEEDPDFDAFLTASGVTSISLTYGAGSDSGGNAPDPTPPSTTENAKIEFDTFHVLSESVSCTLYVTGLGSEESLYSLRSDLIQNGELVRSSESEATSATSGEPLVMHSTKGGLTPETEYTLTFTLLENGTATNVSASRTFTTLAASGSGGGDTGTDEEPPLDYTGKLDSIEDSVNSVGDKVDGVGEAVDSVKQEIAGLPEKIATSLTDKIMGLFVPSQEDLTEIKDKYEEMLSEKLGFIWQAYDLLTSFIGDFQTSLESGEEYAFNFPGVTVPINGEEYVFLSETSVSLDNAFMDVVRPVLGAIVTIVCCAAFINMAHDYVLAIVSGVSAYEFERRKAS